MYKTREYLLPMTTQSTVPSVTTTITKSSREWLRVLAREMLDL